MELIRAGAARCACVRARVPLLTLLYNVYPLLRLHRLLTPTPPPTPPNAHGDAHNAGTE